MEQNENLDEIAQKIKLARRCGRRVLKNRAMLAGILAGAPGIVALEVEFPSPDTMHVYQCMFGRRVGEPIIFRLSFGHPLTWVGISHPWGLKPADIVIGQLPTRQPPATSSRSGCMNTQGGNKWSSKIG